ncbi:nej1p [Saccharomyces arboricola H-6]|uniref:Nej1p n=1 Tax=Saccharomyces arboricola (strain H-6 / AS 2.3317 / CBS 10644) TaxID=1160507 RepID=J8PKA8_SACAR|nr:nej1p [Saccharomyces arboricola H-6]
MNPESMQQQLRNSKWFVGNVNGEENHLVALLPMSSSTILTIVCVSLNSLVPNVFKLTQNQFLKQCQNQGFTDSTSLNQIRLKLIDILQFPKKISKFGIIDSKLNFNFSISANINVSINSVSSQVTKDMCFMILQNVSSVLLQLINVSAHYQSIQRDIIDRKQKCLDFLVRSVKDLDGGSKIINQWAPENSKNYDNLQPSTDDDIAIDILNKGSLPLQDSPTNSLKALFPLQEKLCGIAQYKESEESSKGGIEFFAAKEPFDDDFELQVNQPTMAQANSDSSAKSEGEFKARVTKRDADSLSCMEKFPGLESPSPERTKSFSVTPSTSSSAGVYPRKKRRFGKIEIKN